MYLARATLILHVMAYALSMGTLHSVQVVVASGHGVWPAPSFSTGGYTHITSLSLLYLADGGGVNVEKGVSTPIECHENLSFWLFPKSPTMLPQPLLLLLPFTG